MSAIERKVEFDPATVAEALAGGECGDSSADAEAEPYPIYDTDKAVDWGLKITWQDGVRFLEGCALREAMGRLVGDGEAVTDVYLRMGFGETPTLDAVECVVVEDTAGRRFNEWVTQHPGMAGGLVFLIWAAVMALVKWITTAGH